MKEYPVKVDRAPEQAEKIVLKGYFQKRRSFFAVFLISCAILVGAFAITYAWAGGGDGWLGGGILSQESGAETERESDTAPVAETDTEADEESERETEVESDGIGEDAEGRTVIRTADLSERAAGDAYINNESIHSPRLSSLLETDVSSPLSQEPLVLILHTHTSEGYVPEGSTYIAGELGEVTYTRDAEKSVVAVGRALSESLRKNGIGAIHCTTVHDGEGMRGAYAASMESVRFFLSLYPSIRYVIDLHRDAILSSEGEYIRTVTETEAGACAQVMAVVGSDGNGTPCENWEGNLALALQLRRALNADGASVCRPVTLRNSSYNQELSPYSLLLEIGTGANSTEEAKRAAVLVGEALARLIRGD